jgi:hypothetical protein
MVCLAILLLIRKATGDVYSIHQVNHYDKGNDWNNFGQNNIRPDSGSDRLFVNDSLASITSRPFRTLFPFNEILLCWNSSGDDSSGMSITLSVSEDNRFWYDFPYQKWGYQPKDQTTTSADSSTKADIGYVDTDILKLKKLMHYYKAAFNFYHYGSAPFFLDRISVCYSNTNADAAQFARFSPKQKELPIVSLVVPFMSQNSLPDSIANLTCSPTCLAMALNYYGFNYTAMEVSTAAYDPYSKLYGNWPYNIEAAYELGIKKSWVARHNSFGELADELNRGRPVIISIDVPEGKLSGAPYNATGGGHLIVVRGFDGLGNVLVNDPAGNNLTEGMVAYDLNQLTAVWIGHGGVAYHLWPEP